MEFIWTAARSSAAVIHPGDAGDTQTLEPTLEAAVSNLEALELAPAPDAPAEVVADKGYHAREVLKRLEDGPWTTWIAEPVRRTVLRWHGDDEARRAVYANRRRLLSGVARAALVLGAVLCSGRSHTSWIAAACAAPGCAAGRTSPSATGCTSRPSISA